MTTAFWFGQPIPAPPSAPYTSNPDDQCWCDGAPSKNVVLGGLSSCNQKARDELLGLCPDHYLELTGRDASTKS